MTYAEIKKINGTKYYYRVKSIRNGKKFMKKRVYLGVDLDKKKLSDKEKPEINIEVEKYYDYRGENYSGKEVKVVTDLPALKDFNPDGKFDLNSTIKIKTTPEDIENNPEEKNKKGKFTT